MKPYRLINASEMQELHQHFSQVLQQWNDEYCVSPLSLHCVTTSKNYHAINAAMIPDLALVEGDYLSVINQALFGNDKPCFNLASQKLWITLLNNLFKTEQCDLPQSIQENPRWFYAGSTSLSLTLCCNENNFTLILNPDWVYQQLPESKVMQSELHSLNDALAEQTVSLCLELVPSTLSVKNITDIQVGDVLSTNHPLTSTLRVTRGNQLFAQAELGQSSQHKSILLKRPL